VVKKSVPAAKLTGDDTPAAAKDLKLFLCFDADAELEALHGSERVLHVLNWFIASYDNDRPSQCLHPPQQKHPHPQPAPNPFRLPVTHQLPHQSITCRSFAHRPSLSYQQDVVKKAANQIANQRASRHGTRHHRMG
jgi:hypothetical protein